MTKSKADPRQVKRQHHWRWGHDPNDPDAYEGSPWQYIHIDPAPIPSPPPEVKLTGPDSEVTCFECHHNTYRIIKRMEVVLVHGWGGHRVEEHDAKLMLACPNCKSRVQFYESMLERIKKHKESSHE